MIIKYKENELLKIKELYADIESSNKKLYDGLFSKTNKRISIKDAINDGIENAIHNNAAFYSFETNTIVSNETIKAEIDSIDSIYLIYNFFDFVNFEIGELVVNIDNKYYTRDYNLLILFGRNIAEDLRDHVLEIIVDEHDEYRLRDLYNSKYSDEDLQLNVLIDSFGHGMIDALVDIGRSYESGCGAMEDCDKAMECYKYALENGAEEAAYYIALLYSNGHTSEGVNKKEAFKYALLGTARGETKATNLLGNFYKRGDMVKKDLEMSFNIFYQGMLAGLKDCEISVAIAYHFGLGVKQDIEKAIKMYERLLNTFPLAYYNLACIYVNYKEYNIEKQSPLTIYSLLKKAYTGGYNKRHILQEITLLINNLKEEGDLLIVSGLEIFKKRLEEELK